MAQFRGTIQGSRGSASRLGGKESGLTVTANGWDVGATVKAQEIDGEDTIIIYLTSGSNGGPSRLLGRFTRADILPKPTKGKR